jgi:DNA repair protein RadC
MDEKPHYHEHRKRLRERFRKGQGLADYELMELLLTFAIPRRDVKPTAKRLLKRFGGISGVMDATERELRECEGVGEASALLIRLVKELFLAYTREGMVRRDVLSSPEAVLEFLRTHLSGCGNEVFMVLYLNVKNEVIGHESISEGTVDRVAVYPRRVVEAALLNGASSIILVHNHPTGHVEPSQEDIALTRAVVEAAGALGIKVLDHIIVGGKNHLSLREKNLMPYGGRGRLP